MARFIKNRSKAKGQAPGSLIFIGDQKMEKPIIQLIQYDSKDLVEKEIETIEEAYKTIKPGKVTWINIYGIHDTVLIEKLGKLFDFPPLLLEDILNTDIRPTYEDGEHYDAFILKMLHQIPNETEISAEQVTLILGENYVLTIQERRGDVFTPVRERIRNSKGRVRLNNSDYLIYTLLDTIADNYTLLIEEIGLKVEDIDDRIFQNQDDQIIEDIYTYKTELNFLRKAIRPVKDLMIHLLKSENTYFQVDNIKYLQDLNDLIIQSADAIELYYSLISDQLNIYNTRVSNRMNEVMKVLTIFASIFIPLTFLAGIYGMNFKYIPELDFKYSYLIFWIVVLLIGGGLIIYFRRKKWL